MMFPMRTSSVVHLFRTVKKIIFGIFFYACAAGVYADAYTGSSDDAALIFRMPVWVFSEPQPGTMTQEERGRILPPAQALTELARFLMSGMIYGWEFSYTPADTLRNVSEYFSLRPIEEIKKGDKRLSITPLYAEYPCWYCRAEYRLHADYTDHTSARQSVQFVSARGRGTGERKKELDGIYTAYTEALKHAIRSHARTILKNKPKEITGVVFIKETPRLFVTAGMFVSDLTVLLEIHDIVSYTVF